MSEFEAKENLHGTFGECLSYLMLVHGTRPDGSPNACGEPWVQTRFAEAVGVEDRTVRYWLDDENTPADLRAIERVLFGQNKHYDVWREDLRAVHRRARAKPARQPRRQTAFQINRGGAFGAPDQSLIPPSSHAVSAAAMQIRHPEIRPVPGFTGRDDLLAGIARALWGNNGGTAALTNSDARAAAVKGLGGVGKSVLAREYAWRSRGRYHGVWWVRAETEQTLIDDLIDLGSRLIPNLKEVAERDRGLHLALDAIAGASGEKPWLIVYDNVEKPGAIARLTPRTSAHVLVTSRWPRWQGHAQELRVDVFPEATAVDFLLAERPHETREAAGRLAVALGHLPLALSHARAYCAETNLSFDDYGRRLTELIRKAPEGDAQEKSVFVTFELAITKATQICPQASAVMELAAFFSPERIPLAIVTGDGMTESERDEAVAALFRLWLITHDEEGSPVFTVHRLVQEVVRGRLSGRAPEARQIALHLMHNALDAVAVWEHVNWPHAAALVPHAVAALDPLDQRDEADAGAICSLLVLYFRSRGDALIGIPYAERALAIAEAAQGAGHPETGASLNNLAGLYESQGRYAEAEPLCLRALAIAEAAQGAEHPTTGIRLNNLARLYERQGRYAEAEPLYLRALAIAKAAQGAEHPETGIHLNNLAGLYERQERYAESEPLYLRALAIAEAAHGAEHPTTGTRLNNLAGLYERQGRYAEAEPLLIRALAIAEVAQGAEHPTAGTRLNNLAKLYKSQGRCAEAEPLLIRALAIAEAAQGAGHPDTGACLNNLAKLYKSQGRYAEAEPHYLRALAIFEKSLGPDHPNTKIVRANYEELRKDMAGVS